MSGFRVKSLFNTPQFLLPIAVLGIGSIGYAALTRRTTEQPLNRVVSASLPVATTPEKLPRAVSLPLVAKTMPQESVTHPFQKNIPPPEIKQTQPGASSVFTTRPAKIDRATTEKYVRLLEVEKRRIMSYIEMPMSLVSRTKPTALYSRDINRPICIARAGSKEWIGTEIGIKCADREREIVRIFAAADGLPLGRVEDIATDESGDTAVALVRRMDNRTGVTQKYTTDWKPDQVAVCLYDPKRGRWNELGALPLAELKRDSLPADKVNRLGYDYRVEYRVVLTAKQVIVVPSAVRTDTEVAFAVYDRVTGKAQGNSWEETLQADHPLILVNAVEKQGNTVIFGTDIGLLLYDTVEKTWRRALPTQEISQIAVGSKSDSPIIALGVPRGSGNGYSSPSDFHLFRFSSSLEKSNAAAESLPIHRGGDGILTIDSNGKPWLTYPDCFYKPQSNGTGWSKLNEQGEVVTDEKNESRVNVHGGGEDWDPFYQKPIQRVASEAQIPDNAAIARLLTIRETSPFGPNDEYVHSREVMRWMRQRFARWLSPPNDQKEAIPLPVIYRTSEPVSGFVPDPNDSKMVFGLQGKTLLHLPKKAVPEDEPSPYMYNGIRGRQYKPISPAAKNVSRYPLHDTSTASVKQGVVATAVSLLTDATSEDGIYLITGNGARYYDGTADTWKNFSVPVDNFPFGTEHNIFYTGKGNTPILRTWLQPHLMRLNAEANKFEAVSDAGENYGNAASRGGLWEGAWDRLDGGSSSSPKHTFKYRPLADSGEPISDWQPFSSEPDLPALQKKWHNESCVVTGTVAWFRYATGEHGSVNGPVTIAGYDAPSKRWLAPIAVPAYRYSTDIYISETPDGGALIGIPEASVSVLRYRAKTEKWEPVTNAVVPNEKSEAGFRPLLAPDDTVYAVTSYELCEYDRAAEKWLRFTLPTALHNSATHYAIMSQLKVAATHRAIYIGTREEGLWRMDRSSKVWRPVREPLQWSPSNTEAAAYQIGQIAADKHAVWAVGNGQKNSVSILIRWDRRTKTARFLTDTDTGLTSKANGFNRIVSAGNTMLLWQYPDGGIYRAEPGGSRFSRISNAAVRNAEVAPENPGIVFFLSQGMLYQYDERERRIVPLDPKLPIVLPQKGRSTPMGRMLQGGLVVTENAVYVGSIAGAYRYDRKTGVWSLVPRTESLWVQEMRRDGNTLIINTQTTMARFSL